MNFMKYKIKLVMSKYKKGVLTPSSKYNLKRRVNVLNTEPTILKCKNFEKRYNFLINSWSNSHIQKNFYLSTSKNLLNKKISNFNSRDYNKLNYIVYLVLGDRVVGTQKLLFLDCSKTINTSCLGTRRDLTHNTVFIVLDWVVVGTVQLVYKPIENLLRSIQPIDSLFDLQILHDFNTTGLVKKNFYSKLEKLYLYNYRINSKIGKITAPNHFTTCNSFDEYFFSSFLYSQKINSSLEFLKTINFTDFSPRLGAALVSDRKFITPLLMSSYSSMVLVNPITQLFNSIWSLKDLKNKTVSTSLRSKTIPTYKLILKFKKSYFYVTLLDSHKRIFFSLHTGMFLKFFNYKKSLKKSKSFKILLMRYLRKLLIVTGINNFHLFVRQTSNHLSKLIHVLQKPIQHAFSDPLLHRTIFEQPNKSNKSKNYKNVKKTQPIFNFVYIYFVKTKPFGVMKTKKVGRIKRKIRRKVMKLNQIND